MAPKKKKAQTTLIQIKIFGCSSYHTGSPKLIIHHASCKLAVNKVEHLASQRPIFGCSSDFKSNGHWCFGSVCQLLRKISGKLGLGKCLTLFTSHLFTTFFKACSMQSVCVSYCVVSGWPQIYRKQHCFFCLANENNMLKAARSCRRGC